MEAVVFVNINGEKIVPIIAAGKPPSKRRSDGAFHAGWRVVGVPPNALQDAQDEHAKQVANTERHNSTCKPSSVLKVPPPWDGDKWLRNAKQKPVRSKPYEVPGAAQECLRLAVGAGWLRVEVVEIKKDAT